jgi:nicotinate-nucleotide adenylyltransferase
LSLPASAQPPIGILGGTFDPIHFGHLRLAEETADSCGLESVLMIPAGAPAHRGEPRVSALQRLEMAQLAVLGNPRLRVDGREVARPAPSYTVDTLTELRAELGDARSICLLLGADAFAQLPAWSRWERLFELAHIVVATRPGHTRDARLPPPLRAQLDARLASSAQALRGQCAGAILRIEITALDISASGIRACLGAGASPRYLLPEAVLDYIQRHDLYT